MSDSGGKGYTKEKKSLMTQEQMMELLEKCYDGAMEGLPGMPSCKALAEEYLGRHSTPEIAARQMVNNQIAKCTTSGFLTGLGGLITLPVAIPANVASVLYVQMRMIGALAVMGGYDLKDDEVQTLVYLCLVKTSIADVCKSAGVQVANKLTLGLLKKLPGTVLTKINQKVGFRLLTKFGEKGVINLVKLVPVAGGIVGGAVDFAGTRSIAVKAEKVFLQGEIE